jgi:hypothetical protein
MACVEAGHLSAAAPGKRAGKGIDTLNERGNLNGLDPEA